MYRRILVALDGSTYAERAIPHAAALAERVGVTLTLLRVTPTPTGASGGSVNTDADRREADRYLTALYKHLRAKGLQVHFQRGEGDPAELILAYAREQDADLLILSTHGRGGTRRTGLGSTAEAIIRSAPCPVLLVRG
jgi:nucleotide-binding universal stress UspA family protein